MKFWVLGQGWIRNVWTNLLQHEQKLNFKKVFNFYINPTCSLFALINQFIKKAKIIC